MSTRKLLCSFALIPIPFNKSAEAITHSKTVSNKQTQMQNRYYTVHLGSKNMLQQKDPNQRPILGMREAATQLSVSREGRRKSLRQVRWARGSSATWRGRLGLARPRRGMVGLAGLIRREEVATSRRPGRGLGRDARERGSGARRGLGRRSRAQIRGGRDAGWRGGGHAPLAGERAWPRRWGARRPALVEERAWLRSSGSEAGVGERGGCRGARRPGRRLGRAAGRQRKWPRRRGGRRGLGTTYSLCMTQNNEWVTFLPFCCWG
jgi:hypothetical protein